MSKTALITGAAGGLGKSFAELHASRGGDLVLTDVNSQGLEVFKTELEKVHGVKVTTMTKDLTQAKATEELYEKVTDASIEVDYLINNAGFGGVGRFHERDWEKDLAMIQVNVIALTSLTRFLLPDFMARDAGKILNVSSTASLVPGPLQAVYFATKAYVTSFSNALAGELAGTNVSVTALLPGPTQTGFGASSGMDKTDIYTKNKAADPGKVAKAGYEAMLAGKIGVISGLHWTQRVELAATPFIPKKIVLGIVRRGQETVQPQLSKQPSAQASTLQEGSNDYGGNRKKL